MSGAKLRLVQPVPLADPSVPNTPLGRRLVEAGALSTADLVRALDMQRQVPARLGEILRAEGWSSETDIIEALAAQQQLAQVDLDAHPPDPDLIRLRPPRFWTHHQVLPWARVDGALVLATPRPESIGDMRAAFGTGQAIIAVLVTESQLVAHLARLLRPNLAAGALARVDHHFSCRSWSAARYWRRVPVAAALAALGLLCIAPVPVIATLSLFAVVTLVMIAALRAVGLAGYITGGRAIPAEPAAPAHPPGGATSWPKFSVLVPLYREADIADHLIRRLADLSYPKARLQILLVLEEHDRITRQTLNRIALPPWIRVVTVPASGGLTTKPRAMNFALDFCDGDIIGVWDAEDAPAPNQLEVIADRFARAPANVACLQGVLDFYNPRSNWLARCFTIEYASWFRVVLPGIARLGLVVPLGGTTMFVRRSALERVGAWDAHNVTEDADLGVRLARFGLVTDLIPTVTGEEANCRLWPWIKQRSRWLKGFMVTYLVHMRHPGRLLRDLGLARFLGVQAFFLGTVSQFLLAPVLWSFWLILFGLPHPVETALPAGWAPGLVAVLLASGAINLAAGMIAVAGRDHRHLLAFVPTMVFYFPIGAIAAYKALWELATNPYFWDKTQHGVVRPPP
ncbi:MAG: glycosyltransferase family 2 protein [Marinibacterium sp.]